MALNLVSAKLALQDMIRSGNISVSGLFDLASQVDARVQNVSSGSTFLLYSGGADAAAISANLATTAPDVYDLGSTAAGEFADSVEFGNALRDAIAQEQFGTAYGNATAAEQALIKASVDQHVYGVDATGARVSSTSLFDIISHSYVMENDGHWRIIAVGSVDPNSVAMQTELPALLSKPGDFLINGESRATLAQAGTLVDQVNLAIAQSAAIAEASRVSPSSAGEFLSMTTQKALAVLAAPESAVLLESATATLNRLGWAGMLLSAALVSQAANAAYASGDNAQGNAIIGKWAAELAGGWAGAALAAEIVSSALAPLYLTGPAGAVIAGGLTLLAGLAGGIVGASGADALLSKGGALDSLIGSLQTLFQTALRPVDPLVLDLTGTGIKTVGIDSGAHFDYNGTGFAQQTAWVTRNEGILVLDKRGDGNITGDDLIGNTGTEASTAAASGFTTLTSLDSNGDGAIDKHDPAFSQLRVWIDANGDGKSQTSELKTLDELGITSISLAYTGESVTDVNGNKHLAIGSFTTADGKTHTMEDVWLNVDTARTINTTQVSVNTTIAALPDVAGFGNVSSLHAAMALDTTGHLQSLIQSIIAATDPAQRVQITADLLYAWAGVAQNDPNGRNNSSFGHVIDARKIETLEAFLGQRYAINFGSGADPNPRPVGANVLSSAFDELAAFVSGQLVAQTELRDLYGSVQLSIDANRKIGVNVSALIVKLHDMYQKDQTAATHVIADLGRSLKTEGDWGRQVITALRMQGDLGQQGVSSLLAALGANVVTADASHLVIRGQEGMDNILVGVDKASIYASSSDDRLIAGSGDETLYGGAGINTFVLRPGFGKDTLIEGNKPRGFNRDVVQFGSGVSAAKPQIYRDQSSNLVLVFSSSSQLTIQGYFTDASNQPTITFADGTTWGYTAVTNNLVFTDTSAGGNVLHGLNGVNNRIVGAAGDTIYAGDQTDTITAGQNNTVHAGPGVDTIIMNAGSGKVVLDENYRNKSTPQNQDKVLLGAGITASATQIVRDLSNNLILNFGNGDSLTVIGYFIEALNQPTITFADGTTWGYTAVTNNLVFIDTSAGGNVLHGLNGVNNRIVGAAGDTIYAGDQTDAITAGKDSIVYTGNGANTVTVGQNNTVHAGPGVDTIIMSAGSGKVVLDENYRNKSTPQNQDKVLLGAGIIASATQIVRDLSNNLILNFGNGDSLTVIGYFTDASNQPTFAFTDGTTWGYTAVTNNLVFTDTSAGGNVLHGLNGVNNRIVGAAGDTIYAGDQTDAITAGKDSIVYTGNGANTVTVGQNNTVHAGPGVDTIIMSAGSGKVVLDENYRNKSTPQNQDKVLLGAGITASATQIVRDLSNNLILNFGNGDSLTVIGYFIEALNQPTITFADGTTWGYTAVTNNLVFTDTSAGGNVLHGLNGVNNRIVGAAGDTIYAGDQTDTITAGQNNTVHAGPGVDTIIMNAGSGKVVLDENYRNKSTPQNQDKVLLGAGITASATQIVRDLSNNLILNFGNGDSLTVIGYFIEALNQPTITFADGTTWGYTAVTNNLVFIDTSAGGNVLHGLNGVNNRIVGAAGDTIYAGDQTDAITAGKDSIVYTGNGANTVTVGQNNTVHAGPGVDTIIMSAGSGKVVLDENYRNKSTPQNQDKVLLGAGIIASATQIVRDLSNNLILNFGNGDSLTVIGYFTDASNQPTFAFTDGTTWGYTAVTNNLVFTDTSAGGNVLHGLNGVNNRIVGAAGDTIYAGDQTDAITAGKDSIVYTGNGANTVTVGQNNTVHAGPGVDTIIMSAGSGKVVLDENYRNKSTPQNQDKVLLGAGITASATQIVRDLSNNLILNFGNGDSLTVIGYFIEALNQPTITFADGTTWGYTAVTNNLVFTDTSAGGNVLHGLNGVNNRIVGAAGDTIYAGDQTDTITAGQNNTVHAGPGVDTIIMNAGSGKVVLDENYRNKSTPQNQDKVLLGAGITASATQIVRDLSNNLILNFGNGDSLTVIGYFTDASNQPTFAFTDGTTWGYTAVTNNLVFTDTSAGGNVLHGLNGVNNRIVGAAGDTIYAGDQTDAITAGKDSIVYTGNGANTVTVGQNNTVHAGPGVDTIIMSAGSGKVVLDENYRNKSTPQNQDKVLLGAGITASATQIVRDLSNNLILNFGNGDSLTVIGYFIEALNQPTITFADGTTWGYTAVTNNLVFTDTSAGGNVLHGLNGVNNRIVGAAGDTIYAGDQTDTITAGQNNTVHAGPGVDTIIMNAGSGKVVLDENYRNKSTPQNQDKVLLGAGITASATQIVRDLSNNLILNFGNGDSLTVIGYFTDASNQPTFAFTDGTTWGYTAVTNNLVFTDTSAGGNVLHGLNGVNNRIVGAAGDTIYAGDQTDAITAGKDSIVYTGNGANTVTVGQNNTVHAGPGVDTIIMSAGSGKVVLDENYRNKSTPQNQDKVLLGAGITASATQIVRDLSNNLILNFGNGDSLTVIGYFIEALNQPTITFADGTTWGYTAVTNNLVFIDTSAGGNVLHGLNGVNNRIVGAAGDTIYAGDQTDAITAGKDSIVYTGNGANTVTVGQNNTVHAGPGVDTIIMSAGSGKVVLDENYRNKSTPQNQDKVLLGAGIIASATQIVRDLSNNLILNFGNGDSLTVIGYFTDASNQPTFAFTDGTTWGYTAVTNNLVFTDTSAGGNVLHGLNGVNNRIVGAAGDTIYAGDQTDAITAGKDSIVYTGNGANTVTVGQNNTVHAGPGVDTIIMSAGSGKVVLDENYRNKSTPQNQDKVLLGAGITASATQIVRDLSNNLILNFGNGDSLTVIGYFIEALNQPTITFADGTTWGYTAVTNNLVFTDTSAGGNVLHGLNGVNNRIVGAAGDTIYAGDQTDTITVGKNNTVFVDGGADIFQINSGTGTTTLHESAKTSGSNQDVLQFNGVNSNQLWFSLNGNDLEIDTLGTLDHVKIDNWVSSAENRVSQIRTADSVMTSVDSSVAQLVQAMAAYGAPLASQTAYTSDGHQSLAPILASSWHRTAI